MLVEYVKDSYYAMLYDPSYTIKGTEKDTKSLVFYST